MEYENLGCLHDIFKRQAALTPDFPAVVDPQNGITMTFRELDHATDILATKLRICGVQPDGVVAIYSQTCLKQAIAHIGILKSGGAHLTLKAKLPIHQIESYIQDSKAIAIITCEDLAPKVQGQKNVIVLNNGWAERLEEENGQHPCFENPPHVGLDNLLFIAYSSGTTGLPKGIMCTHRGEALSHYWRNEYYPFQPNERVACSVFFDWELMGPLIKGIPMYIIPDDVVYNPPLLLDYCHTHKITRINLTPTIMEVVLEAEASNIFNKLSAMKIIWIGGEMLTTTFRDRIVKLLPQVKLMNIYGAAECSNISVANLSSSDYDIEAGGKSSSRFCPVGKIFPGCHFVIMDENLTIMPVGAEGEVFIGGPTLARGYLNRPEENAKRFVKRPDSVPAFMGEILYRTGDVGYLLANGSLTMTGRCGSLVKIHGFSVVLQEVEAAILGLPMVNAARVLAEEEKGSTQMIAYVVPKGEVTAKDIRTALKKHLIYYKFPSDIVFVSSIPIAAYGKLDKKALAQLRLNTASNSEAGNEVAPTTSTEKKLSLLWSDVLRIKNIDIEEEFVYMGGHAMLAPKLLEKIKEVFSLEFAVVDFLSHFSSIKSMARIIDNRLNLVGTDNNM